MEESGFVGVCCLCIETISYVKVCVLMKMTLKSNNVFVFHHRDKLYSHSASEQLVLITVDNSKQYPDAVSFIKSSSL